MILAKTAILEAIKTGELKIESVIGFQPDVQISANSIDLTLGRFMLEIWKSQYVGAGDKASNVVDLHTGKFLFEPKLIDLSEHPFGFTMKQNCFYLAVTNEWIFSQTVLPQCYDKSSMARMATPTHYHAGFFDVSFAGHTTLEIAPEMDAICYQNQMICQISLTRVEGSGDYNTEGRYMNTFDGSDPKPILSKGVKILKAIK
jgi:deoxycytidine triphosphate deaminase